MNRLLILSIFLLAGRLAGAQSIYEFEYYFDEKGGRDDYKAFFVRNEDGTGFIRVRFVNPENKQYDVVQMDMQEAYDTLDNGNIDSSVLVIVTQNPVFVSGDPTKGYDPDHFLFKKTADGFFEPWAVVSFDEKEEGQVGVLSSVKLLEAPDLTQQLVSQYFSEDDPFYKNLFAPAVVRSAPGAEARGLPMGSKLYLILVANTNDASIGTTCVIDKDLTYKLFQQIAEYLEMSFTPQVIFGKYFSKVNVDNAINSLRPSPNDVVVFYYTGHGYSNPNDGFTFPYMDLRTKDFQPLSPAYSINMQDVYNKIKEKGARLNLILSDCCNSDPNLTSTTITGVASLRSSSLGWSLQNCQTLFLSPKRTSILMTAASKGELSAGNNSNGGFFTFNFRESLEKRMGLFSQFASWKDLVASAKQQTITKANNTMCPNVRGDGFSKCKQTPTFVIE